MDRYQVSLKAYHELSQICQNLPRLPRTYTLETKQEQISSEFEIIPTPGSRIGAETSLMRELCQDSRLLSQNKKFLVSIKDFILLY